MYGRPNIYKFTRQLKNSFVLTGAEVIHINEIFQVQNVCHFNHSSYLYTELRILVDATSYSLKDGQLKREHVESIMLTLDTSEIFRATDENVALLLLNDCQLVRTAIEDWCTRQVS